MLSLVFGVHVEINLVLYVRCQWHWNVDSRGMRHDNDA